MIIFLDRFADHFGILKHSRLKINPKCSEQCICVCCSRPMILLLLLHMVSNKIRFSLMRYNKYLSHTHFNLTIHCPIVHKMEHTRQLHAQIILLSYKITHLYRTQLYKHHAMKKIKNKKN